MQAVNSQIDLNLFNFTFENPEYTETVGEEDVSLDFYEDYYGLLAGKVYGTLSIVEDEDTFGFDIKVRAINLTTVEFEDESKLRDLDRRALEDKVLKEGTEFLENYFREDDLLLEDKKDYKKLESCLSEAIQLEDEE